MATSMPRLRDRERCRGRGCESRPRRSAGVFAGASAEPMQAISVRLQLDLAEVPVHTDVDPVEEPGQAGQSEARIVGVAEGHGRGPAVAGTGQCHVNVVRSGSYAAQEQHGARLDRAEIHAEVRRDGGRQPDLPGAGVKERSTSPKLSPSTMTWSRCSATHRFR